MKYLRAQSGLSLIELLVASAIITTVMLTVASVMLNLGKAQQHRHVDRIAQQLAQDQIEILKTHSFANLRLTAEGDAPDPGCLNGDSAYDRNPDQYPPEVLRRNNLSFERFTCVEMVRPSTEDGKPVRSDPTISTAMKRVVVRVRWPADHPQSEQELESIESDSYGPQIVSTSSATFSVRVFCTHGVQDPLPCAGIVFYLLGTDKSLIDSTISNEDGQVTFHHAPSGSAILEPQLENDEEAEPSEATVTLPPPDNTVDLSTFTVSRPASMIHITTDRENTLVTLEPGLPTDPVPDVSLRKSAGSDFYGRIISDSTAMSVHPGSYSLRCWSTDSKGKIQMITPPGGLNLIVTPGGEASYVCHFPTS